MMRDTNCPENPWRGTQRYSRSSLCPCYKCLAPPRLKKLSVRVSDRVYIMYYTGTAEIHKDQKTEPPRVTKPEAVRRKTVSAV